MFGVLLSTHGDGIVGGASIGPTGVDMGTIHSFRPIQTKLVSLHWDKCKCAAAVVVLPLLVHLFALRVNPPSPQVLLFEGSITLLVPLQEAVHSQAERDRFPRVYQRVIGGIICFYCFFGMTCWMAFGDTVRTVFTTSLPAGYLATSVQLAYSLAVVFTFPLQNFPALEICTKFISTALQRCNGKNIAKTKTSALTQRNILSSMLVCALAVVALLTMDSLDKVVSLMGSLLGCPIAFFFPPLIHSKLAASTISPTRKLANTVVAFLGVCAMIAASVTTLIEW